MTNLASGIGAVGVEPASQNLNESLAALGSEDFLQLLITQLQHQDPTDPMDNREILEQLTALRSLEANTQLTNSLRDLNFQYRISAAAGLLGHEVLALTDSGAQVSGVVTRVLVGEDDVGLVVRGPSDELYAVRLSNVVQITERGSDGDSDSGE